VRLAHRNSATKGLNNPQEGLRQPPPKSRTKNSLIQIVSFQMCLSLLYIDSLSSISSFAGDLLFKLGVLPSFRPPKIPLRANRCSMKTLGTPRLPYPWGLWPTGSPLSQCVPPTMGFKGGGDMTVLPPRDCLSSSNCNPGCCKICSPSHVASSSGRSFHLIKYSLTIIFLVPQAFLRQETFFCFPTKLHLALMLNTHSFLFAKLTQ
jgi:hypothetical protein